MNDHTSSADAPVTLRLTSRTARWRRGDPASVLLEVEIHARVLFDVDVHWRIRDHQHQVVWHRAAHQDRATAAWLPNGRLAWRLSFPELDLPTEGYRIEAELFHKDRGQHVAAAATTLDVRVENGPLQPLSGQGWIDLVSVPGGIELATQAWHKGHADWFFRHFAHAAEVVGSYMLGDSPQLHGRVLDLGCGDGITDLGIALRWRPAELIGIDPFRGYERLPAIMAEHGLGTDLPGNLRFEPQDANQLSFPDNHFDVVVSWGSLEHIAGGYDRALSEVRRVLKPGGLFFVHPGLYYANYGHHLGEFCSEPHFHLTWPRERIQAHVLANTPHYMDRAGEFASSEQYWQWFTELNPITVQGFEAELRALDFELWRAALRTEDRVEYHHPALQAYSMVDLATLELYVSCINRKPA